LTKEDERVRVLDVAGPGHYDFWGTSILYNVHLNLLHKYPANWYQILFKKFFALSPPVSISLHSLISFCIVLIYLIFQLRTEVDEFKKKYFGKFTVGIQVRTWTRNLAGGEAVRNPVIPIEVYLQAAEAIATLAPVPFEDVVFFISCPDISMVERARHIYGNNKKIAFLEG
jgi:hypothetical protein